MTRNNLLNVYKHSNGTYTSIDSRILIDDYKSVAERELLYERSRRYYVDADGDDLTYRDPFPVTVEDVSTDRKRMILDDDHQIANPGRSLEEFLGECVNC